MTWWTFGKGDPIKEQTRRYVEERITEIRRELVVGEACAGPEPETWKAVEEELLDELAELELSLLKERKRES